MSLHDYIRMPRRTFATLAAGSVAAVIAHPALAQQGHDPSPTTPIPTEAASPLNRFLAVTPDSLLEKAPDDASPLWFITDLAQQLATFFVSSFADDAHTYAVTRAIYLHNTIIPALATEPFAATIGFGIESVGKVWGAGDGDRMLQMYGGDLPLDALPGIWEAAGFTRVTVADNKNAWTLGGPADFDLGNPIQSVVFSDCNNATISDEGVVIFARDLAMLEQVHQGPDRSMLAVPKLAELVMQLSGNLVGCEAVSGTTHTMERLNRGVLTNPDLTANVRDRMVDEYADMVEASDQAVGAMPEWSFMVMGVLAGTVVENTEAGLDAAGEAICRIHAGTPEAATQVTEVLSYRWLEGDADAESHAAIAEISESSSVGDVAIIDFAPLLDPLAFVDLQNSTLMWPFLHGAYTPPEDQASE